MSDKIHSGMDHAAGDKKIFVADLILTSGSVKLRLSSSSKSVNFHGVTAIYRPNYFDNIDRPPSCIYDDFIMVRGKIGLYLGGC